MRFFCLVLPVIAVSVHAQSLLPIPQLPVVPTLPLAINPDGYFVFSWSNTTVNSQSKIIATNPPVEVRSGVIGLENFAAGSWFLKTNGEVFVYTMGGGSMEPNRLSMPNFFKSDIAKFYRSKGANPYYWFGISRNGQTGIMFDTNQSSFSQPSVLADVVDIYLEQPFKMMTLHAGGNLKAWDFNGGNLVSIPHPISFYSDVRAVEGTLNQGLVILGNGQVKGWKYNSGAGSYEELILPAEVSSNVVQISGPSYQSTSQISYALKTNGSLVAWDIQGQILPLPVNLSGKEFVSIRGNIESAGEIAAFALATDGSLHAWKYNASLPEEVALPSALQTDIRSLRSYLDSMGRWQIIAWNSQGGLFKIGYFLAPISNWAADPALPAGVLQSGGVTGSDSFSFSSGGGAAGELNYSLSTNGDLAVQTYAGLSLEVLAKLVAERIRNIPNNFGLATKTEVGGAVTQGVQQVLSAPSDYNLFTPQQVQAERTAGQNDVVANPNQWTLYTTNQIKAMVMGDLMLTRTNNGQFVLNYDIEQSDDLTNWAPYQAIAMPLTNLPTDKAFVRIKLKNQQ